MWNTGPGYKLNNHGVLQQLTNLWYTFYINYNEIKEADWVSKLSLKNVWEMKYDFENRTKYLQLLKIMKDG